MPFEIVRNDITRMKVDAIVDPSDNSLSASGGLDGHIHSAAGDSLRKECNLIGTIETGKAKITKGYDLPCKYVIHTVGPRWSDGMHGEKLLLASCYQSSLALAKEAGCESVAFPLISSGNYGFPKELALRIAVDEITSFLSQNEMSVYLVIFDRTSYLIGAGLFDSIAQYIDDKYAASFDEGPAIRSKRRISRKESSISASAAESICCNERFSLSDALKGLDESFSEMLFRKIRESGMSEVDCYKKANIDRKLFSKIRSDRFYRPSKNTVLAFALALELDHDEIKELLMKAGYALSRSSKSDIIVEYFIEQGNYNIHEINEALFSFDQSLIGGRLN